MNVEEIKMKAKQLLETKIPEKIARFKNMLDELKTPITCRQAVAWESKAVGPMNESFNKSLADMLDFYYPLILWLNLMRPPMEAVESFQLHVMKTAIAMLEDCENYVKIKVNNTAEFYVAYGKAIKRTKRNPDNVGYEDALKYIRFQRKVSVVSSYEDILHNLLMIDDFFKKNLSIIEGSSEKHLFH